MGTRREVRQVTRGYTVDALPHEHRRFEDHTPAVQPVKCRGYRDGVRNLEVMVESLSAASKPEIQEKGIVMARKFFCLSILGGRGERRTG